MLSNIILVCTGSCFCTIGANDPERMDLKLTKLRKVWLRVLLHSQEAFSQLPDRRAGVCLCIPITGSHYSLSGCSRRVNDAGQGHPPPIPPLSHVLHLFSSLSSSQVRSGLLNFLPTLDIFLIASHLSIQGASIQPPGLA